MAVRCGSCINLCDNSPCMSDTDFIWNLWREVHYKYNKKICDQSVKDKQIIEKQRQTIFGHILEQQDEVLCFMEEYCNERYEFEENNPLFNYWKTYTLMDFVNYKLFLYSKK